MKPLRSISSRGADSRANSMIIGWGLLLLLAATGLVDGTTVVVEPGSDVTVREGGRATHVLFSGDVGRVDAVLSKDPEPAPEADSLVVESTYGNRTHPALSILDQLEGVLKKTFARGGVLVIPAFAVGRAQQMVYLMDQLVTDGRLEQGRADTIKGKVPARVDKLLNRHFGEQAPAPS